MQGCFAKKPHNTVILNEVKNRKPHEVKNGKTEILRLSPQNDKRVQKRARNARPYARNKIFRVGRGLAPAAPYYSSL